MNKTAYLVTANWHDAYDRPIGIFASAKTLKEALPAILKEHDKDGLLITRHHLDEIDGELWSLSQPYFELLDGLIIKETSDVKI
jgi:hypothetical protein